MIAAVGWLLHLTYHCLCKLIAVSMMAHRWLVVVSIIAAVGWLLYLLSPPLIDHCIYIMIATLMPAVDSLLHLCVMAAVG